MSGGAGVSGGGGAGSGGAGGAGRGRGSGAGRVLVTGGAGFIGSVLVDRLLAEGRSVDVVDDLSQGTLANLAQARSAASGSAQLSFHQMDIRSPDLVRLMARRRPHVVYHLAAQADVRVSVARPGFDADVNILGSIQVLEGARAAGAARVVFAASGGTLYGDPAHLPVDEAAPHRPLSPYGVSKKAVIDYLFAYRRLYGLEYCALALANVYGPRQDPNGEAGVVAIFAGSLLAGEDATIYGDGTQTRDFVFVDDVVDAFVRATEAGDGLVVNIGTGAETSVNALYATMARAAGVDRPPVKGPPRPGELARSCLDRGRALVRLGWKPWTTLEEGVAAVLAAARRPERGRRPGLPAERETGGP